MRSILLLAAPLLSVTLLCGCPTEAPPSEPASAAPAPPPVAAGSPAHQRAVEVIAASPFAEQGAVLAGALAPHVTLLPSRVVMDELPMGASRLAGSPDVLPGFAWPMYGEEPMALLAQLNLAELAEHAPAGVLPEQGWLTLFRAVESGDRGDQAADGASFALRYHTGPSEELVRTPPPVALPAAAAAFAPCSLRFEPGVALPDWRDLRWPEGLDLQQRLEDWYELRLRVAGLEPPGGTLHHLLGHPQLVAGDPRNQAAQRGGGEPGEWNLLLQLESDEPGPNWVWGELGTLYLMIRDEDLDAGRFEGAWLVLKEG
jgi:hypothetical protein